jgi:hypothetical protein
VRSVAEGITCSYEGKAASTSFDERVIPSRWKNTGPCELAAPMPTVSGPSRRRFFSARSSSTMRLSSCTALAGMSSLLWPSCR